MGISNKSINSQLTDSFPADKQMSRYSNPKEYEGKSWFRDQMFVSDWIPAPSIVDLDSSLDSDSDGGG